MPVLAGATVFELDLPGTQQYKKERLQGVRAFAAAVRFIPTDLTTQPLGDVLAEAGLDRTNPVLFVWEGVTQYLPEAAVRSTLTCIGTSVPGSTLVFTYVQRRSIDESAKDGWSDIHRPGLYSSEPWLFGLAPSEVAGFLGSYRLNLIDDVGKAEFLSRYAQPLGRLVELNDVEHAALAVVRAG